jgi:hypothetical protein
MRKHAKIFLFSLIFFVIAAFQFSVFPADSGSSGDDKIGDMTEDIKKKEKEQKEKDKDKENQKKKDDNADSDNSCMGSIMSGCIEGCAENLLPLINAIALSVKYADYPYADNSDFVFSGTKSSPDEKAKIGFLKLSFEPSYLMDNIWGLSGRLEAAVTILYLNCLYQYNFSEHNAFSVVSANAGLTFPIGNVALSIFAGGFKIFLPDPGIAQSFLPSFGGSLQIFFPGNIAFEIFNLNAIDDALWFTIIEPSVSFQISRFGIGAGFIYYDYAGTVFMGPAVKCTIWL